MRLTDIEIKNAKPRDKLYKLTDGQGMFAVVMPNGGKYWRYKYRYGSKEKLLSLGTYPEVSLKEARDKRGEAKKLLEKNIDPALDRKKSRISAFQNTENTFEKLAREWWDTWRHGQTEKHALTILNRFEADVFPVIGAIPVDDITPPVILDVLKRVEAREAYDVARRIKQTCGQIFRFGMASGRAKHDPTACLKEAIRPYRPEHYPALDVKELPRFLEKLEDSNLRIYPQTKLAMRFLMYTFVRTSEMICSTWPEFDLDEATWIIPAARMKMRRDHIVPLSTQSLEILHEIRKFSAHREWVFPNQARPRKHMSNATLTRTIMRMGDKGQMSGHGFRALAMTTAKEKLGYRHEVIDRQLAHAHSSKIVAAYDRAQFLDERREMMQKYGDYLDMLCLRE